MGTDLTPGTYRTEGGDLCTWSRLSGFGGTTDEIIAIDIASGPTVVTIGSSDVGFSTDGCADWAQG